MRRIILPMIAFSLAAAPVALEAQTPRPERGQVGARAGGFANPAERVLQHREVLGLTAEQVTRLEQVRAEFAARNQPLLDELRAARLEGAKQRRQLTEEQRAELRQRIEQRRAQLTPEQHEQMQQQREQMRQQREQMAHATPEQRQQMREEMRQQMQQRREAMTPEQREQMRERMQGMRGPAGAPGARMMSPERRAQMEALRPVLQQLRENGVQARQQVEAVLTAEQAAKLRELRLQRRGEPRGPRGARSQQGARR